MAEARNVNYNRKKISVDEIPKADRYFIRYIRGDDECPEIAIEGDKLLDGLRDGSISAKELYVRDFKLPFAEVLGSRRAA